MADTVAPLLDAQSAANDPSRATTAVLLDQQLPAGPAWRVAREFPHQERRGNVLSQECPRLKVFCTLSPVPGFAAWLEPLLKGGDTGRFEPLAPALKAVAAELGTDVAKVASDPANAVERLGTD